MPPLTKQEHALVAKLKQLKALQDAQKQNNARKAATAAVGQGTLVGSSTAKARSRPGQPGATNKGPASVKTAAVSTSASTIPGETPHQRALRLLKAKQAAAGSGASKVTTTVKSAAVSSSVAPSVRNSSSANAKPALAPVQRRPSQKRPNVKRHAPPPSTASQPAASATPQPLSEPAVLPPSPKYNPPSDVEPDEDSAVSPPSKVARRDDHGPRGGQAPGNTLFIGDLPLGTESHELQNWFEPFGAVVNARVLNNYGFVTYEDPEAAEQAYEALQLDAQPMTVHGRTLRVDYAKGPGHAGAGRQDGGARAGRRAAYADWDAHNSWSAGPEEDGGYDGPEEPAAYRPPLAVAQESAEEADRAAVVYDDL